MGDSFCVRNGGMCPLLLSALEPYLMKTHAGPVHAAVVSVSSFVHGYVDLEGHVFMVISLPLDLTLFLPPSLQDSLSTEGR